MRRPTFHLRGPDEIVLVDSDGKEHRITIQELLVMLGEAALIAQLLVGPSNTKPVN